uniref:Glucanase n=1 Tax=Flammulina velutipes TaxID=38945 RepID=G8A561_FLAVE|nr:putative cellulase CEL6B [Flammulina velutipes]
MLNSLALFALVSVLPAFVSAQSPLYGQCGGKEWTGATTCASGSTCVKTNEYYSQCLPSSSAPSSASSVAPPASSTAAPPTSTGITLGNPYTDHEIYLSPYYADEVVAAAAVISDSSLAAKALKVKDIPTFTWFDVVRKVPDLGTYLADASAKGKAEGTKYLLQIVVYDLPDRDCAALASNGEFAIADDEYPDVRVVAVVEPDSLANLVTNLNVAKCAGAQAAYTEGVTYAIKELNKVKVYMYVDAGHAGWLGWPANLTPAAKLFNDLYAAAGSPPYFRGLATNVANYNALSASTPDPVTTPNDNYDEIRYINALAPLLSWDAKFIVDQGRSGQQNIRQAWGNWCNVIGAGFGIRPTLETGSPHIDSVVWIKPGGECDGTSDKTAVRYDGFCGKPDAMQNAPEAGSWFQAYFEQLVAKANPPL